MRSTRQPESAAGDPRDACPPADGSALPDLQEGPFQVRFARDWRDLEAVQRLRFAVFNLELGEGLERSFATGLDQDEFDPQCHHLMLVDRRSDELVGTYRMQTAAMARAGIGFYCAREFDLDVLPAELIVASMELGRACIERRHRNGTALFALWRGLAAYAAWCGARYLFGCSSLTSQDPAEGLCVERYLRDRGFAHEILAVRARPGFVCREEDAPLAGGETREVSLPRLFGTYLRYGAKLCGSPAIDRDFRTIDYFLLLDLAGLDPRVRQLFFGAAR